MEAKGKRGLEKLDLGVLIGVVVQQGLNKSTSTGCQNALES